MSEILALSIEIRQKVYKLLDERSLKNLSASCSAFRSDVAPILWHYMMIGFIHTLRRGILNNLVYTKTLCFDFLGCDLEDKDIMCENFKVYLSHCGSSMESIIIAHYNLDGDGRSVKELKKLPNLRNLRFVDDRSSKNQGQMTSSVMQAIAELTSLKCLEFVGVKLEVKAFKAMCSKGLTSLTKLILERSGLTDPGTSLLKNLKSLEIHSLEAASITHVGLKRINGLVHLKELRVYSCKRIKSIPVLDSLPALEKLSLAAMHITDASLVNLNVLPRLRKLSVTFCKNLALLGLQQMCSSLSLTVLGCFCVLDSAEVEEIRKRVKFTLDDTHTALW